MMHFASGINCPPYETADAFLEVAAGRTSFCGLNVAYAPVRSSQRMVPFCQAPSSRRSLTRTWASES